MSKKGSRKELNGVYRRCLSVLNQVVFNVRVPSPECFRRFETRVANEMAKRELEFEDSDGRKAWVNGRIASLYQAERLRLIKDPNAASRAWIKNQMGHSF